MSICEALGLKYGLAFLRVKFRVNAGGLGGPFGPPGGFIDFFTGSGILLSRPKPYSPEEVYANQ
ncbi:MAG: hypothetical protein LBC51_05195 [Treponema sp.]|nr:hypothetical protein [Treponema sp.]